MFTMWASDCCRVEWEKPSRECKHPVIRLEFKRAQRLERRHPSIQPLQLCFHFAAKLWTRQHLFHCACCRRETRVLRRWPQPERGEDLWLWGCRRSTVTRLILTCDYATGGSLKSGSITWTSCGSQTVYIKSRNRDSGLKTFSKHFLSERLKFILLTRLETSDLWSSATPGFNQYFGRAAAERWWNFSSVTVKFWIQVMKKGQTKNIW